MVLLKKILRLPLQPEDGVEENVYNFWTILKKLVPFNDFVTYHQFKGMAITSHKKARRLNF